MKLLDSLLGESLRSLSVAGHNLAVWRQVLPRTASREMRATDRRNIRLTTRATIQSLRRRYEEYKTHQLVAEGDPDPAVKELRRTIRKNLGEIYQKMGELWQDERRFARTHNDTIHLEIQVLLASVEACLLQLEESLPPLAENRQPRFLELEYVVWSPSRGEASGEIRQIRGQPVHPLSSLPPAGKPEVI